MSEVTKELLELVWGMYTIPRVPRMLFVHRNWAREHLWADIKPSIELQYS